MFNDLRYAVRSLRKAPVLVCSTVFCLALGVAASVAVFSSVDALVLKPLPYEDAQRMVNVRWKNTKEGWDAYGSTTPDFLAYREQCRSFEHLVAFRFWFHTIGTPTASEHTHGYSVTSGFFKLLGIKPILGRGFEVHEEVPSNSNVAVLSHSLWQRRFDGDRDVLGKTINVDGAPRTIVGVLPDSARSMFRSGMGDKIELWLPLAFPDNERVSGGWHSVWGKLKRNVSFEQANEEMKRLSTARAKEFPDPYEHRMSWLESYQGEQARRGRETVSLMVAAVAMFLLLSCCNVANLFLSRNASRQQEFAIRVALGASPMVMVRQVLADCILLSVAAAVLGIAFSYWGIALLEIMLRSSLPPYASLELDGRALVAAVVVSILSAMLFASLPAWIVSRTSPGACLKAGGNATTAARGTAALRGGLVVSTIAISVTLVVCTGLLVRSILYLSQTERGIDPNNVATVRVQLARAKYTNGSDIKTYYKKALSRLAEVPGVESVGVVSFLPLHEMYVGTQLEIEGRQTNAESNEYSSAYKIITPNYHDLFKIPLLAGRLFDATDTEDSLPVCIISRETQDAYFPDQNPVGQRLRMNIDEAEMPWSALGKKQWRTIVGVVGHVSNRGISEDPDDIPEREVYLPLEQQQGRLMHVLLKIQPGSSTVIHQAHQVLREVDPAQPIASHELMTDLLFESFSSIRNMLWLLIAFSVAALVLSSVGIFGIVSDWVRQQQRELGIRMAIGAEPSRIRSLVLRRGLLLACIGCVVGVVIARVASRLLSSRLYGVTLNDVTTYVVVVSCVLLVTLIAAYLPARKASQIDAWSVIRSGG